MKYVIACVLLLCLAGCGEPTAEQVQYMNQHLPAGCTIQDLGSYGYVEDVVVVKCNGKDVATTSYEIRHAKTHSNYSVVTMS